MKSKFLTIFLMGMIAVPGLMALSTAKAQPPGMTRNQMDEESRQRMWGDNEMMSGYGRMGASNPGERGTMYGPMMGPGMPYGPMMGQGMMYGPMMNPDMMMGNFSELNLNKEQRNKIRSIMRDNRKTHMELMRQMLDASDKLSDLYDNDTPDPDKIGKAYDDAFSVKKQMIQEGIRIQNKIFELLTKEQRENYKKGTAFPHRFDMMNE